MELKEYYCTNCNPTIFNPEYKTKCVACSNRPVHRIMSGLATYPQKTKPDFKSVLESMRKGEL